MIAVADNADLAELYGIRKDRVLMVSILVAGVIVGIGMFLYGTRAQVQPSAATELMLYAVAATVLGGIGNLWGAAFAAVILGVVQNSSILFIPSECGRASCSMPSCSSRLSCSQAVSACRTEASPSSAP